MSRQVLVALLRAVNVGGTGKLAMAELVRLCEDAGFADVRTYIASGNAVFSTGATPAAAKAALEAGLAAHAGKPVAVAIRTAAEMAAARDANPFAGAAGNRVVVYFLDAPPPSGWEAQVRHRGGEGLAAVGRELYVHYGEGMAKSKLVVPAVRAATGRNLNTVARLAAMAAGEP